jgi:UDP-N-acetyl-D-mannosaminuronic acid transferase (WecB/TagA/CpsF family)
MWKLCERCEAEKVPIFFYGSTEKTLESLSTNLNSAFPNLIIAGMESPHSDYCPHKRIFQ